MKLSICCTTYNHEKYISEALDSFLYQNIDFEYEIIIGDDASIDNTKNILIKYQNRYPGIIKPIFRTENIGPIGNFIDVLQNCSGEYIAYCDGDDYWTNPNKIRIQLDALAAFPECSFSFHNVNIVDSTGQDIGRQSLGRKHDKWSEGEKEARFIVGSPMVIVHANSILFKKEYLDVPFLRSLGKICAGDYPLTVMLCSQGNAYYFPENMSAYRKHGGSISNSRNYSHNESLFKEIFETHSKMNLYYNKKFDKEIKISLKGQLMMKAVEELDEDFDRGNYWLATKSFLWMILNSQQSQYSIRDILWLLKQKLKSLTNT